MRKIYKELTKEQKERGVIFSSTLSDNKTETEFDTIHEVFESDNRKEDLIKNLSEDGFFKGFRKYNIIRR